MKSVRPFLIVLGIIAVVCAVVLAVALTPSVQRWALLRATAGRPGLQLGVTEVSVGLGGVSLRGMTVQQHGLSVKLERLDADYSLLRLLWSRRLQIHRLTASGLLVDASHVSAAKTQAVTAGAPAAAPGLLGQLHLPVELVLDDVSIEGRALLPGAPSLETEYKISGGKFAPGQEGSLLLVAALKNPEPGADVAALNVQVSLRATQTAEKTFSRVGLTAVVDATGRSISDQSQLKLSAELVKDAAGENYSLSADTLLKGATENLLAVRATLPAGGKNYAGQWTLKARAAQLQPFLLKGALPDFNAHGEGRFTFNPVTAAASLQGTVDAAASRLEALEPALRAIGAVSLSARFDVEEFDGIARLHQLDVTLAGEKPVLELHASGAAELNFKDRHLQVGPSGLGQVLDLNLTGLPLAWVRPFVHEVDLSGDVLTGRFTVTAEPGRLLLHTVQPLRLDEVSVVQRGQLLLNKAALSLSAEAVLTEKELTAQVSEFSLKTPAGDSLSAQATVTVPAAASPAIAVTANYTADLPKLLSPWLPLGRVKAAGDADLTLAGEKINLRHLNANVTDGGGLALLTAASLRSFTLDLAAYRASTGQPGAADLLRLTLGRLPLDQLPLNQPGAKLGGTVEQGQFVLAADGEKLTLRTEKPFILAGVSLAQGGQPALTALRIEARPSLEVTGRSLIQAQTGDVTITTATGATLLAFKGEATRAPDTGLRGALTFNIEMPALSSQPLFADAQAVTAGRASGEIRAALGGTSQVEARLTVNGLVARDGGPTLPVANLSFRAVAQNDGRLSVQAPLLLDRAGQRSDLNFALELTPAKGAFGIEGKLTGERMELADVLSLLGVFTASAAPGDGEVAPAAAAPPAKLVADAVPAWSRFSGSLGLDIKSVTRGTEWSMTGLTGSVLLQPGRLALEKLAAAFGEKSRLAAKGEIRFSGGAMPYELSGDFSLNEFDAGKLFKALEPAKPATVEGLFTVQGHFTGAGETLGRTVERSRGAFEFTSRQGIFRGLQRASSKVSMTSKALELGASVLGSLFGQQNVTKAAEKVAGTAYFVDQLAQSLGELKYDQFNAKLVRDDSLNLTLSDISLVSPDLRLLGKGTVTNVADKPLLEQPLSVTLSLAARGNIEQLLGKLKLLDGSKDEFGYSKVREPVTITGSLTKPDPTAFFTKIATSKIGDLLGTDN